LRKQEQRRLLAVIADTRYAAWNRMSFTLSYMGGLRVGEIAQLAWGDVLDSNGAVREKVCLPSSPPMNRTPDGHNSSAARIADTKKATNSLS
jgi:hypothetical protein